MNNVSAAAMIAAVRSSNRSLRPIGSAVVEPIAAADRPLMFRLVDFWQDLNVTGLDILWAVAEGLVDRNVESFGANRRDAPGQPIAAPCGGLDAENADLGTVFDRRTQWVTEQRRGADGQCSGVGTGHEAGPARHQRGPGTPALVDTADQYERQ
jgi:hypothetical protein